ncbi:MAG: hypothetical protein WC838_02175, partial [Candidatus Margulisiibacteriota bacterium]
MVRAEGWATSASKKTGYADIAPGVSTEIIVTAIENDLVPEGNGGNLSADKPINRQSFAVLLGRTNSFKKFADNKYVAQEDEAFLPPAEAATERTASDKTVFSNLQASRILELMDEQKALKTKTKENKEKIAKLE